MSLQPLEPSACFLCGHVAACDGSCGVVCVLDTESGSEITT